MAIVFKDHIAATVCMTRSWYNDLLGRFFVLL